ncbi:MAG TPA: ribonuclease domain-containing protein [Micromonosporaceae bacterium]
MRYVARAGVRATVAGRLRIVAATATVALAAVLALVGCAGGAAGTGTSTSPGSGAVATATPRSGLPTVPLRDLPPQVAQTLALVDNGGPYPYRQDGTVFGNLEGHLPKHARGYYREFTVPTPGSSDRGARRLVVGRDGDVYYTADHYQTFRQVLR